MLTQEQCYKKVKRMYISYTIATIFPFLSRLLNTNYGFCSYLRAINLEEETDTLLEFIKFHGNFETTFVFWFPIGKAKPRRDLLKKAITMYKLTK